MAVASTREPAGAACDHYADEFQVGKRRGFSFPLVGDRRSKKKVLVWGRAPESGKVAIQVNKAGKSGFKTIKRKMVGVGIIFKNVTFITPQGNRPALKDTTHNILWLDD